MPQSPAQTAYTDILTAAFAGQVADCEYKPVIAPAFNTEVSASIPFGWGVVRDNTAPYGANGIGAKLPAATTDKFFGITVFSHSYSRNPLNQEIDSVGMLPGTLMNVMRRGRIWAIAELGSAAGDKLFVRCTAAGQGKGSLLNSDPGGSTVIANSVGALGQWQSAASALGLAIAEVYAQNA
jgi:hypothetical protein